MSDITLEQARAVIAEHQRREGDEQREQMRRYVGRFFKFQNSYGGDSPKWWLYVRVTGVNKWGRCEATEFQDDGEDKLQVRYGAQITSMERFTEIEGDEYTAAADAFKVALLSKLEVTP